MRKDLIDAGAKEDGSLSEVEPGNDSEEEKENASGRSGRE